MSGYVCGSGNTVRAHPPMLLRPPGVTGIILLGSSSPTWTESNSFLGIPRASLAPTWLLSNVASLISGSAVQGRGGERPEIIMYLSWGDVLSNSASPLHPLS